MATNRVNEAEPLLRRALQIDEQHFGSDHPSVANRLSKLGHALSWLGRTGEAESHLRRALDIAERSYGPDSPAVANVLAHLSETLLREKRYEDAEPLCRRALQIDEKALPDHPNLARDLNNLALSLADALEAEPLLVRALAIDERSSGADHSDVARDLNSLALVMEATQRLTEAARLYRRQLVVALRFAARTGFDHPYRDRAQAGYERLLRALGSNDAEVDVEVRAVHAEAEKIDVAP